MKRSILLFLRWLFEMIRVGRLTISAMGVAVTLFVGLASAQPLNDDWDGGGFSLVPPFTIFGNNFGATTQTNEQDLEITGATVWWSFIPQATQTIKIDTFGSNFDTVLHIYTDSQNGFGNFTLVAANDQAAGTPQSRVAFNANADQRYEIRVGGFLGEQGNIQLN